MNDKVTLTTFALQEKWVGEGKDKIKRMIDEQIASIINLKSSFEREAIKLGRTPPTFSFSAIMVPHWKSNGHYTDQNYATPEYIAAKKEYFDYLQTKCEASGIEMVDFYESVATPEEKRFLEKLEALGSTADLMKTRAIINSKGTRHLQIDTNTHLSSISGLYRATFGAENQHDGLNASYYDSSGQYVSAHNKIVYTCEESPLATAMLTKHESYIRKSQHDLTQKTPQSNQIYPEVFCQACLDIDAVEKHRKYYLEWNNLWSYYQAKLDAPIYHLSKYITTAINMSWSQGDGTVDYCEALKHTHLLLRTPSGNSNDLDYQSIAYLIKKYTNPNLSSEERQKLLALSDLKFEEEEMIAFIKYIIAQHDVSLLGNLLRTIPNNQLGEQLKLRLFNELIIDSELMELIQNPIITDNVTPENLETISKFIPDETEYLKIKHNLSATSTALLAKRVLELDSILIAIKDAVFKAIQTKFSSLSQTYQATEKDRMVINDLIDLLVREVCLQELSIDEFKRLAVSSTTNRFLSSKLINDPRVIASLREQSQDIQEKIRNKIYLTPKDDKVNQQEIDRMIEKVLKDIEETKIKMIQQEFAESPEIKFFIKKLDTLAESGEQFTNQVARMEKALTTAVKTLRNQVDYAKHLRNAYDTISSEFPNTSDYDKVIEQPKAHFSMFANPAETTTANVFSPRKPL